jgi:hypothetical protein
VITDEEEGFGGMKEVTVITHAVTMTVCQAMQYCLLCLIKNGTLRMPNGHLYVVTIAKESLQFLFV